MGLEKIVEEQKKIIGFLQKGYLQAVGKEMEIPQTWTAFLNIDH